MLYLDSNAFAKLYLDEDNREQEQVMAALEQCERVSCAAITYAEVGGVLARLLSAGMLSEADYTDKLDRFTQDWETVNLIDLFPAISVQAVQIMKAQAGLRAMDALHLASALALRQATPIKFLSFDKRLQDAAHKLMPDAL